MAPTREDSSTIGNNAIGPIHAPEDVVADEHLRARDFFVEVEHVDVPPALYPGAPFRFSSFGAAELQRAPTLGEHTAEVLGRDKTVQEAMMHAH